jgi:hypothetical protein
VSGEQLPAVNTWVKLMEINCKYVQWLHSKFSKKRSGIFIPDPALDFFPSGILILNPEAKKAPDLGSRILNTDSKS